VDSGCRARGDFVTACVVSLWLLAIVGVAWLRSDGYPQRFPADERASSTAPSSIPMQCAA
jgi:hypothetical protein